MGPSQRWAVYLRGALYLVGVGLVLETGVFIAITAEVWQRLDPLDVLWPNGTVIVASFALGVLNGTAASATAPGEVTRRRSIPWALGLDTALLAALCIAAAARGAIIGLALLLGIGAALLASMWLAWNRAKRDEDVSGR